MFVPNGMKTCYLQFILRRAGYFPTPGLRERNFLSDSLQKISWMKALIPQLWEACFRLCLGPGGTGMVLGGGWTGAQAPWLLSRPHAHARAHSITGRGRAARALRCLVLWQGLFDLYTHHLKQASLPWKNSSELLMFSQDVVNYQPQITHQTKA